MNPNEVEGEPRMFHMIFSALPITVSSELPAHAKKHLYAANSLSKLCSPTHDFFAPPVFPRERPRVLAVDGVDPAGIQILEEIASVDSRASITAEELQHIIPAYDALIVRSATSVTETLIRLGSKLKVIGRAGVGVDNICLEAATARGIYVVNSPQGNTIAAAELALTLMMALSRKVTLADKSVSQGHWERSKFQGSQVHGKTIGIVGIGQVGSYIALICKSMEMEVLAYDPFVNQAKAQALGVTIVSLEDLLKNSDIVTLHVPLIPSTRNLIRAETLALMRPHALLINTSRGGVVDEAAVAKALTEGRLGGAALDVFCNERAFSPDNPLLVAKEKGVNLILTPHIGASTREAQINVSLDVAQQVKHILLGELPKSAVNLPVSRSRLCPQAALLVPVRIMPDCSRKRPFSSPYTTLCSSAAAAATQPQSAWETGVLPLGAVAGVFRRLTCRFMTSNLSMPGCGLPRSDSLQTSICTLLHDASICLFAQALFVHAGRLSSQLLKHPMEGLHLKVFGDIENEQLDVLLLAVTQGALAPHCEHRVNFVNVRQLAAAHKIKLSVSKAYGSRSNVFFEVTVHSSDESASLGGCSTNEGTLILRSFKGMPIAFCMPQINAATPVHSEATTPLETSFSPASMAGAAKEGDLDSTGDSLPGADFGLPPHHYRPIYMFYTLHVDRPGVLSSILSIISSAGINVANCHLGRRWVDRASQEDLLDRPLETASPQGPNVSQGGASGVPQEVLGMCIFHIDSAVDENLLESIRQLQYVREAMVFATPCTLGLTPQCMRIVCPLCASLPACMSRLPRNSPTFPLLPCPPDPPPPETQAGGRQYHELADAFDTSIGCTDTATCAEPPTRGQCPPTRSLPTSPYTQRAGAIRQGTAEASMLPRA
ncbi:uncharacterized protein LOC34622933 [Cyclospora cayetanensis]|uniref:Uncharacterized protein LOC34622933 n=1 Tax=Cyclospora cayetanensis TaxID=88456 RepID=A0A6P6S1F7_9EIME|nr:uncharacterized protein LOC34622933 [Cyclospora cayetanensis]